MPRQPGKPGARPRRRNQLIQERVHDAYKSRGKLPEPTLCPECGAVYHGGRWQWLPRPDQAHADMCPACHRIRDRFPAGYVKLEGGFLAQHRDEVLHLVRNVERREKAEHPLQRIIDVEGGGEALLVTTTDIHLARGIGEAVHHAYQGELAVHYSDEENLVRVSWKR